MLHGHCAKKEHYLTDRFDVIFEVPKCSKIVIFRGIAPDPTGGAYCETVRAYIALPDLVAAKLVAKSGCYELSLPAG